MVKLPKNFWLIAPFAVWMVLMWVLPSTIEWYAWRTVIVGWVLILAGRQMNGLRFSIPWKNVGLGVAVGLVVFVMWILPEQFDWAWYRKWCIIGEGGTQAVAESRYCDLVFRFLGSAFVISIAEELFFRKWLIGFAGFWWTVALFAIEHDRWLVAALCGIIYGWFYLRRGLGAVCVAHITTNLVLGLWILKMGQWQFW